MVHGVNKIVALFVSCVFTSVVRTPWQLSFFSTAHSKQTVERRCTARLRTFLNDVLHFMKCRSVAKQRDDALIQISISEA